jgi:phage baseplate assembly protein W
MKRRIAPVIPLFANFGQYDYIYSDDLKSVVNQNLEMIMLTRKGERVMSPNFGVGAQEFLFEYPTHETKLELKSRIVDQLTKYASYITLQNVDIQFIENSIAISIRYLIDESQTSHEFFTTIQEQI